MLECVWKDAYGDRKAIITYCGKTDRKTNKKIIETVLEDDIDRNNGSHQEKIARNEWSAPKLQSLEVSIKGTAQDIQAIEARRI